MSPEAYVKSEVLLVSSAAYILLLMFPSAVMAITDTFSCR
jgi:hypothetical protein